MGGVSPLHPQVLLLQVMQVNGQWMFSAHDIVVVYAKASPSCGHLAQLPVELLEVLSGVEVVRMLE